MFILKVTNKESGLVEQTNFTTQEQCLNHKVQLESSGYVFVDRIETIPTWVEIIKEAWIEEIPAELDETGMELKSAQQINHEQEVILHEQSSIVVKTTHEYEIIEDNKAENLERILELESKVTNRRIREALLSGDYSFIKQIEEQIKQIRESL
jgi:hypothetical protein